MATATKTNVKTPAQMYLERVARHTESPIARRRQLKIGRGGSVTRPRRHHLPDTKMEALREEFNETGELPNPYRMGLYFYSVEALKALGANEWHSIAQHRRRMQQMMSRKDTVRDDELTDWDRFVQKENRNEKTGRDPIARHTDNLLVLQRLSGANPYGYKLVQVGKEILGSRGMTIDLRQNDSGTVEVRLNTDSDDPHKLPARKRGAPPKAKAKAKKTRKSRNAQQTEATGDDVNAEANEA